MHWIRLAQNGDQCRCLAHTVQTRQVAYMLRNCWLARDIVQAASIYGGPGSTQGQAMCDH
jgi:hypothetical protein